MLDQLSGGRLELGLGRGSMPYELSIYGIDPASAQRRYLENFEVIRQAFLQDEVTLDGEHLKINRFPVRMRPLQRPHPPLWYATTKADSAVWAAQNAANIMTLGSIEVARGISERYRGEWARMGRSDDALPNIGITRHVVVADTEAEALAIGQRAYRRWREAMEMLWKEAGTQFPIAAVYPDTFDELLRLGNGVAGTAQTVSEILSEQVRRGGLNYVACQLYFGDMTQEQASHSATLLAGQVALPHDGSEPARSDRSVELV